MLKDDENKVIAIEQNDNGEYSTKYNRVNCSKILQSLGVEHEEKKRYEAEFEDGKLTWILANQYKIKCSIKF